MRAVVMLVVSGWVLASGLRASVCAAPASDMRPTGRTDGMRARAAASQPRKPADGAPALELVVTPRLDPLGRPWRIGLFAPGQRKPTVANAAVSPEGRWWLRGLAPGQYEIRVVSQEGVQWLRQVCEIDDETGTLALVVPVLKVEGLVRVGRSRLPARLVFVDEGCAARIPIASGDDGRFEGFISASAQVSSDGWRVEVQAGPPPVRHVLEGVRYSLRQGSQTPWFDLTLAPATVSGVVFSADGQPAAGVDVSCESLEQTWQSGLAATDRAGRFRFVALPPGRYRVTAEGCAEPQDFAVAEGGEHELQFIVAPPVRLQGQVLADGLPVGGAAVHVWRGPGVALDPVLTSSDGRFEVNMPSDVAEIGLTVLAPECALTILRIPVAATEALTITVDRSWGQLVLDLTNRQPGADIFLVGHNASLETIETLNGWANDHGGGHNDGRLVVPQVAPGEYALCMAGPADVAALWNGEIVQGPCTTGVLDAGGTLSLTLPRQSGRQAR